MGKTKNNSLRLQQAVRSIFEDYRQRKGCLGHVYEQAACGCDNALQMWRGPKGDRGPQGPQGPKGDNAGSFLVDAEFVVDPEGQEPGSYLKLVLIDVAQQEQVVYVDLSELTDIYTGGDGISVVDMVVAAKLGAGLTFDNQGNITSAYQFCDGLDETSNVVTVKLDASNNILGFAGSGCKGLTATVNLTQAASGVALVLTGAGGTVLNTIPLTGGTGITIQKDASGFTWLVDPSDIVSSTSGNNVTISGNKLYVGDSALTYATSENGGVFTLTNADGNTSTFTLPTTVQMLSRADMVCEGENAPYLRLTFKRDNGQNLYQDIDMSCLATAELSLDVSCDDVETEPVLCEIGIFLFTEQNYNNAISGTHPRNSYDFEDITPVSGETSVTTSVIGQSTYAVGAEVFSGLTSCEDTGDAFLFVTDNPAITVTDGTYAPVPLSDLLNGVELKHISGTSPFGNKKLYLTAVANQDSSYTFSVKFVEENVLTADLVSGENRVDLKPLLEHIGGHIEDCPTGETAVVPIIDPEDSPLSTGKCAYIDLTGYATAQDCCAGAPTGIHYTATINNDGSATLCFESAPNYFLADIVVYIDGEPETYNGDAVSYATEMDWDTCEDINCSASAMIAAGAAGVTLRQLDWDINGMPTGKTLQLCCVAESTPNCYTFSVIDAISKPMLKIGPSCEPCIDLSPLTDACVHIEGEETINGVKTFNAGYFGNVEALVEDADTAGLYVVDTSHATAFTLSLDDDTEFDFTGVPAGRSSCFSLKLDNGGDYTVTWPLNVYWCNDTEPELTSGGTDILTFMTFDGGQTWYGTLSMTGITANAPVV